MKRRKNDKLVLYLAIACIFFGLAIIAIERIGNLKTNANQSINAQSEEPEEPSLTIGQINAIRQAKNYIAISGFSYNGLIKQLVFEGYSEEDSAFGAFNCGADWNEQAARKAKEYISMMAFSKSGLMKQLLFEGFTEEQATYGVEAVGY